MICPTPPQGVGYEVRSFWEKACWCIFQLKLTLEPLVDQESERPPRDGVKIALSDYIGWMHPPSGGTPGGMGVGYSGCR